MSDDHHHRMAHPSRQVAGAVNRTDWEPHCVYQGEQVETRSRDAASASETREGTTSMGSRQGVGGLWQGVGGLCQDEGGPWQGVGGLWQGGGGLWQGVGGLWQGGSRPQGRNRGPPPRGVSQLSMGWGDDISGEGRMTINTEAFRAWLKECEEIQDIVFSPVCRNLHQAHEVFIKAIRPYFYYLQEWEKNHDGGGRESGTASSGEAGSDLEVTRVTLSAPAERTPVLAANTAPSSVRIRGDTKPHKDRLRTEWHLRWDPKEKMWYGKVPSERQKEFLSAMKEMKLEVVV